MRLTCRNSRIARSLALLAILTCTAAAEQRHAKNVVLFLGDAGGIPTLNAASLYGHAAPQKLFLQHLPHIGLSDTSAANGWVTDSAAGMTAIVTGVKTNNGVLSQSPSAVRGKSDGEPLKTILEYAEEKGLATGVMSNMPMSDATPAACYAHSNDRRNTAAIVSQIMNPRFGDGVDVVVGGGKKQILAAMEAAGTDLVAALSATRIEWRDNPAAVGATGGRIVALFDGPWDPRPVLANVIRRLSQNPKGYFLMVEWDMHTDKIKQGLDNALVMDDLIRQTAAQVGGDTLILFTADHSFDLRLRGGKTGEKLSLEPGEKAPLRMDDGHTGEEVLVAAQGPGAERVRGFMANTGIFQIMMAAYGW